MYARTLGVGGGDAGGRSNREFPDLWAPFLSGVAALTRPDAAADRARLTEDVCRAGRDLAANLSAHGHGLTYYAGRELAAETQVITALLSAPDVRSAFGARDLWQVVDQVAALAMRCIAPFGRLLVVGFTSGRPAEARTITSSSRTRR